MSLANNNFIKSITSSFPDELSPLPEIQSNTNTGTSFLSNITWETWIIIILILALLGINIFAYLAKGTEESVSIFGKIFNPILKFFGYSTLTTTKQTVETTATGTKAGVDIAAGAAVGAIDTIQQTAENGAQMSSPIATTGTSTGVSTDQQYIPPGQMAPSSLPVQQRIQEAGANVDKWQQDSLARALDSAKQSADQVSPDDSRSSFQTTGKAGWCYIGEEQGIRTCSEIGVNDVCMSGDVFPNQAICMNPNLRA